MALILAAPATGKSTYVKKNRIKEFLDGDDIIFNNIGIPPERPDPSQWTDNERLTHMRAFIGQILKTSRTCIAFSEVDVHLFDPRGIPTVVVEVPEQIYAERVKARHRTLRQGCNPRPDAFYASQRTYLRRLASVHGLRVFTSFDGAIAALEEMVEWRVPEDDIVGIRRAIVDRGFCIVPGLLPRDSLSEIEHVRSALETSRAKLSNHLTVKSIENLDRSRCLPQLKETVYQYLNPHRPRESMVATTLPVAQRLLPLIDKLLDVDCDEHVHLFNDTILTKNASHTSRLHWHQVR